jgi:hypothetical protein
MKTFKVFFISYDEPNADVNYDCLLERYKGETVRITDIAGIANAYAEVFKQATTDFVYIVEGDNFVLDTVEFKEPTDDNIHAWPCINRSTQTPSFNGGIKLFPVEPMRGHTFNKIDVLLNIDYPCFYEETAWSVHGFDTDEFHTVSHTIKQYLRLVMMRNVGELGIDEEWERWIDPQWHSLARKDLIMQAIEYAKNIKPEDIGENFFDGRDDLMKIYNDNFKGLVEDGPQNKPLFFG